MKRVNCRFLSELYELTEILCFDIETTGLDPLNDEILKLSVVDMAGNVLFDELFSTDHKTSWEDATKVNGITPDMVYGCRKFKDATSEIERVFNDAKSIIGYNISSFDLIFLHNNGIDIDAPYMADIMLDWSEVLGIFDPNTKEWSNRRLSELASVFRYEFVAHDSLDDARATIFLAKKVIDLQTFEFLQKRSTQLNLYREIDPSIQFSEDADIPLEEVVDI
ncbi:MAG: 3'-5' exonuclease [Saccharofermentans sp.]|nr:3'-5' exonuclease [Saccharofermentans sp.]